MHNTPLNNYSQSHFNPALNDSNALNDLNTDRSASALGNASQQQSLLNLSLQHFQRQPPQSSSLDSTLSLYQGMGFASPPSQPSQSQSQTQSSSIVDNAKSIQQHQQRLSSISSSSRQPSTGLPDINIASVHPFYLQPPYFQQTQQYQQQFPQSRTPASFLPIDSSMQNFQNPLLSSQYNLNISNLRFSSPAQLPNFPVQQMPGSEYMNRRGPYDNQSNNQYLNVIQSAYNASTSPIPLSTQPPSNTIMSNSSLSSQRVTSSQQNFQNKSLISPASMDLSSVLTNQARLMQVGHPQEIMQSLRTISPLYNNIPGNSGFPFSVSLTDHSLVDIQRANTSSAGRGGSQSVSASASPIPNMYSPHHPDKQHPNSATVLLAGTEIPTSLKRVRPNSPIKLAIPLSENRFTENRQEHSSKSKGKRQKFTEAKNASKSKGSEGGADSKPDKPSSSPFRLIKVESRRPYRILTFPAARHMCPPAMLSSVHSTDDIIPANIRIMGGPHPLPLYIVAADVSALIHSRKSNIAKAVSSFPDEEKGRMTILCNQANGTVSTHSLTVLTVDGTRRLLNFSCAPVSIPLLAWFEEQLVELTREGIENVVVDTFAPSNHDHSEDEKKIV